MSVSPQDLPTQAEAGALVPNQALLQASPDGRWLWNGQQWVPNGPQMYAGKSKVAAGLFGILLGGLGVHKFYLGKVGLGLLYVLFCWTLIPALVGLVEGIIYLTMSDADFARKYGTANVAPQLPYVQGQGSP